MLLEMNTDEIRETPEQMINSLRVEFTHNNQIKLISAFLNNNGIRHIKKHNVYDRYDDSFFDYDQ